MEIIGTHIKPTESTTLAKLTVLDQVKLLFSKLSNNDVAELDATEKLSVNTLTMKASLLELLKTASDRLTDSEDTSVTLRVSSKYLSYLDSIIDKKRGLGRYYEFDVFTKNLPANVNYFFIITIRKKVS